MEKIIKSEDEWKKELTPEQFHVLRQKETEHAFTGTYTDNKKGGVYQCAGCGLPLFSFSTKFDSGSGWPSFFQPEKEEHIEEHVDNSLGRQRTEVTCARCGGHLGHVFEDGPQPTGLRYCINSVSLTFDSDEE
jgi:peptide-methionine (R)-S-oxide reductase